jgi:hypothetical protein
MKETLSPWKIILLPVVGSIVLIVLFYFLKILRYFLIAIVAFSSFSSISFVTYPFWFHLIDLAPYSVRYNTFRLPARLGNWLGVSILPSSLPASMAGSLFFIVIWLTTNNWFVTDLIALCLGVTSIVSLQLPSAMLATLLLVIFWIYDIFWVFISPLIFPKNVMETVAVGVSQLELPMIFKVPRILAMIPKATFDQWTVSAPNLMSIFNNIGSLLEQYGSPGFIMLGLGDIILPGLALNFFYRRDQLIEFEDEIEREIQVEAERVRARDGMEHGMTEEEDGEMIDLEEAPLAADAAAREHQTQHQKSFKWTYYLVAQIGYAFGLVLTFVMLILLKRGQPALLYLVPCTLIPPFCLSWHRGQFKWLWQALPSKQPNTMEVSSADVDEMEDSLELSPMESVETENGFSLEEEDEHVATQT